MTAPITTGSETPGAAPTGVAPTCGAHPAVFDQLRRWARLPGPTRVLDAARITLEAGSTGDRVRVRATLDTAGRDQVGRLLGLSWVSSGTPVTLGLLRTACARNGTELVPLLEALGGPLRDRRAEKADADAALQQRRDRIRAVLAAAVGAEPVVELLMARRWLGAISDEALPTRADDLARLLTALPADGALLANVAQDVFDDPHALDRDRLLGRAATRTLAALAAHAGGASTAAQLADAADTCSSAAGWRSAWASAGVTCDQLSSTVLALNVRLPATGAADALLTAAAAHGEPVWLTARALRDVATLPAGSLAGVLVRVCENPSVVQAAADALGAACPPLLCTYGRPSTAAWTVLRALRSGGAQLAVSADRDTTGRSIAAELLAQLPGSVPWLPDATGLYEEERLAAYMSDLSGAGPP